MSEAENEPLSADDVARLQLSVWLGDGTLTVWGWSCDPATNAVVCVAEFVGAPHYVMAWSAPELVQDIQALGLLPRSRGRRRDIDGAYGCLAFSLTCAAILTVMLTHSWPGMVGGAILMAGAVGMAFAARTQECSECRQSSRPARGRKR